MSKVDRQTQSERNARTRQVLITQARKEFVKNGYANASTQDVVAKAGVSRGALYHHFSSKTDLFKAVVEQEAEDVARRIESATPDTDSPVDALENGASAFFDAMKVKGRTRLLLIESPAVLGAQETMQIDQRNAKATLVTGLTEAMALNSAENDSTAELALLLSASFDRAALAIDQGCDETKIRKAMLQIIHGVIVK